MMEYAPGQWGCIFAGGSKWAIKLGPNLSEFTGANGKRAQIPTSALATAQVTPGLIWADISFDIGQKNVTLSGLTNKNADQLFRTALRYAEQGLKHELKELRTCFQVLATAMAELFNRERYIRRYDIEHLLQTEKGNVALLPRLDALLKLTLFSDKSYDGMRERLAKVQLILQPPFTQIVNRNSEFVRKEKQNPKWQAFFQSVEKTPLTAEQQDAVIIHEDRNRLVAAAGSGKSSTLVAKVGYAITKGYVEPHEVLALAFNDKAAKEICERLKLRLRIEIKAKTFHSMGNEILKSVLGKKRLEKNTAQLFQNIVTDLCHTDEAFFGMWLLFKAVHWQAEPEKEFESVEAYEAYIRTVCKKRKDRDEWGIPSLRGDAVKSFEELAIANWLFVNGVDYKYEALYEHDVTVYGWGKYEPDFVYESKDGVRIYHEHFALRADNTSPFGATYEKSVKDKRALHVKCSTTLIETASASFKDGSIFVRLKEELELRGVTFNKKSTEELKELLKERNDRDLIKLMQALIAHAKESGYDESHFEKQVTAQRDAVRTMVFLRLLFPVWRAYTLRLTANNSIDFADMIGLAAKEVESGNYPSPAKLILVDEFQDISPGRARLVKALLNQHPDSVLFGVGDDWQAINRFAGSDLSIMREFEANFGKTETRYLSKTFRSNQGISNVSAKFVMKNGAQIAKKVEAIDQEAVGVVRIVEYDGADKLKECISTKLQELALLSAQRGKVITVLIIGRYRYETTNAITESDIDAWNTVHNGYVEIKKNIDEEKKTSLPLDSVHKSKGLEADFVLVHSMQAGRRHAFPCEMEDDLLLALSFSGRERFAFAEERRLFYVALTRAREQVTLYSSAKEPSRFILELLEPEYGDAVFFEGKTGKPIPCDTCKQGYMQLKPGVRGQNDFYGCTRFNSLDCTNKLDKNGVRIPSKRRRVS